MNPRALHRTPALLRRGAALLALCIAATAAPASPRLAAHWQVVHGWPAFPPGVLMGDGAGVAVDPDGAVLAFHRAGRQWTDPLPLEPVAAPTLIAFDRRTGKTIRQWGAGLFAMPHGLSVDRERNVWVTDVALHQVFKLSPGGDVLMTLGQRGVPGDDATHFNRPTDVLVNQDGSFFVSDGYGNARIMKFDRQGRFLFQWGSPGSGPGQFKTPHALARTSTGRIVVADRNNSRLQLFEASGRYIGQWRIPGLRPFAIANLPGRRFAVVGNAGRADSVPETAGGAILDEAGRILARFGGYGRGDGQFVAVHDVAADRSGAIYAIDVTGGRVQKFVEAR